MLIFLPKGFQVLYSGLCIMLHLLAQESEKQSHSSSKAGYRVSRNRTNQVRNWPAVNSRTTTTVIIAQIAFFPIPLNSGSTRYSSETRVKDKPTFKAWITLLGSSPPTFHTVWKANLGNLFSFSQFLVFSPFSFSAIAISDPAWTFRTISW